MCNLAGNQGNSCPICPICDSFNCKNPHIPEKEWMQRKLPQSTSFAEACETLRRLNRPCRCNCGKNHATDCKRCGQPDCYSPDDCTYCTPPDCAQRLILKSLGLNNCPHRPNDVDLKFFDVMAMCSREECRPGKRHHVHECPRASHSLAAGTCASCGGAHETQRCPFAMN